MEIPGGRRGAAIDAGSKEPEAAALGILDTVIVAGIGSGVAAPPFRRDAFGPFGAGDVIEIERPALPDGKPGKRFMVPMRAARMSRKDSRERAAELLTRVTEAAGPDPEEDPPLALYRYLAHKAHGD